MPLHYTTDNHFIAVSDKAYLDNDEIDLPDNLKKTILRISPSKNSSVSEQQEKWLNKLTPETALEIAFKYKSPHKFCAEILNWLDKLEKIPNELKDNFRNKNWLVDIHKKPVTLNKVINLPEIQNVVTEVMSKNCDCEYWNVDLLSEDITKHSFFKELKKYLPNEKKSLVLLGELIAQIDDYWIGTLKEEDFIESPDILKKTAGLLKNCPSIKGWEILAKILNAYEKNDGYKEIFSQLIKDIPLNKVIEVLQWIWKQGNNDEIITIFNRYLVLYINKDPTRERLSELTLVNSLKEWRNAKELCHGYENISKNHILHKAQAEILGLNKYQKTCSDNDNRNKLNEADDEFCRVLAKRLINTPERLKLYFDKWDGLVPSEMIGVFLFLLGSNEDMRNLAKKFLGGNYPVEWIQEQISENIQFDYMFSFKPITQANFNVHNIINKFITVPIAKQVTNILVGEYEHYCLALPGFNVRQRVYPLYLYSLPNLEEYDDLPLLLKNSCEYILRKIYKTKPNIDALWEKLQNVEQLDIDIARNLILDNLPNHIRTLGINKTHKEIDYEIKEWDDARIMAAKYEDNLEKKQKYEENKKNIISKIEGLIISSPGIQKAILEGVSRQISNFQYDINSVPFEIFQNADDAVSELLTMRSKVADTVGNEELSPIEQTFILQSDSKSLSFMHWGRLLNDYGKNEIFWKQGFNQDLEKMLTLLVSDKQYPHADTESEHVAPVTGKFGLGFKSLLLICDKPRIVSGRLAVEIIVGLLPQKLKEEAESLRQILRDKVNQRSVQGTIIAADLNQEYPKIIPNFECFAGYLAVFARHIRRIEVKDRSFQWQEPGSPIIYIPDTNIEVGTVQTLNENESFKALYFRYNEKDNDKGGILLRIGENGFQALPEDIPKFWVLNPVQEETECGFAVNAQFDVDAGRARLSATSKNNQKIAKDLGVHFGMSLCSLFEQKNEKLSSELGLSDSLTSYEFWNSLWEVLISGWTAKGRVGELLEALLCDDRGLGRLITECSALPNGLSEGSKVLTSFPDIQYVIPDEIAEKETFEILLNQLPMLFNGLKERNIVANRTKELLGKILPNKLEQINNWRVLLPKEILDSLIYDDKILVSIEMAEALGLLIDNYFEKNLYQYKNKFFFMAENGEYYPANTLLSKYAKDKSVEKWATINGIKRPPYPGVEINEERLIAGFAPNSNLINSTYTQSGLNFIEKLDILRPAISNPKEIAEWIKKADTLDKQSSASHYLSSCENRSGYGLNIKNQVIKLLNEELDNLPEWLQEVLSRINKPLQKPTSPQEPTSRNAHRTEELTKLYEWWMEEQELQIQEYNSRTYPNEIFPISRDDPDARQSWLTLFVLGACHRLGRAKPQQHRNFINLCQREGWWNTFADVNPVRHPEQWISILETYVNDKDEKYSHWMQLFPIIYRMSRGLEAYIETLSDPRHTGEDFDLNQLLQQNTASILQGGGFDAPQLKRALGFGACFVLRELARNKIIETNRYINPYCYVPVGRTRDLLERMGCIECSGDADIEQSRKIHAFLVKHLGEEKATFNGAYDIPLQLWAEK